MLLDVRAAINTRRIIGPLFKNRGFRSRLRAAFHGLARVSPRKKDFPEPTAEKQFRPRNFVQYREVLVFCELFRRRDGSIYFANERTNEREYAEGKNGTRRFPAMAIDSVCHDISISRVRPRGIAKVKAQVLFSSFER